MRTAPEFTVAELLAWTENKPANEYYNYIDGRNCALSQFLRDTGRAIEPSVIPLTQADGGGSWYDKAHDIYDTHSYPAELEHALSNDNDISKQADTTFGALSKRLKILVDA